MSRPAAIETSAAHSRWMNTVAAASRTLPQTTYDGTKCDQARQHDEPNPYKFMFHLLAPFVPRACYHFTGDALAGFYQHRQLTRDAPGTGTHHERLRHNGARRSTRDPHLVALFTIWREPFQYAV